MNDFRLTSYESYMTSHTTPEIENEIRNLHALKKLTGYQKTTVLAVRFAPVAVVVWILLTGMFK